MKSEKIKIRKALIFAVLFAVLAFLSVGCASAATIYVPDNYAKIQWAVDNISAGGLVIIRDGVYTENVYINKSLTIESENGHNFTIIQAADSNKPVFIVSADNVSIVGFTIKNAIGGFPHWPSGVSLGSTHYCLILNNNISDNWVGVSVHGNWMGGEYTSSNNMITNNIISNNRAAGISLGFTSSNVIGRNIISGNHNAGISMGATSNNIIVINTILNNEEGIANEGSPVENNTIQSNYISNNSIGIGFTGNTEGGIFDNLNNTITDNVILNNREGIWLTSSSYNNISRNNISNNHVGIELDKKALNTIYLNNFIANVENIRCDFCNLINIWNSTSRITYTYNNKTYSNYLGNYWDDYTGTDDNQDGIGEDPYSTDLDKDYYPLMQRFENYIKVEKEREKVPGFEAIFAIAGLLAMAYLLRRGG